MDPQKTQKKWSKMSHSMMGRLGNSWRRSFDFLFLRIRRNGSEDRAFESRAVRSPFHGLYVFPNLRRKEEGRGRGAEEDSSAYEKTKEMRESTRVSPEYWMEKTRMTP